MTEREKVFEALRQMEEHSPTWVAAIRAYIIKIENQRGRSPASVARQDVSTPESANKNADFLPRPFRPFA